VPRLRQHFVAAVYPGIKHRYGPHLPPGGQIYTTVPYSLMLLPRFAIHGGKSHNRGPGGRDLRPCYHADTNRRRKHGISGHGLVSWGRCAHVPNVFRFAAEVFMLQVGSLVISSSTTFRSG
jgi:hypothetical protein